MERRVLTPLGFKPFRCSTCRERFYRWSRNGEEPEQAESSASWRGFLNQHDAGFEEVVARLARREAEMDKQAAPSEDEARHWWRRDPVPALREGERDVRAS